MRRTLSLKRESLAELTDDQLAGLSGAGPAISSPNVVCRVLEPSGTLCTWAPTYCLCPEA